jgi:DNA polymerase sigma
LRLSAGTAEAAIPIIRALSPDKTISAIIICDISMNNSNNLNLQKNYLPN